MRALLQWLRHRLRSRRIAGCAHVHVVPTIWVSPEDGTIWYVTKQRGSSYYGVAVGSQARVPR